ncbi:MAG: anaerobic ribonucleoside-triphosphate reductase activating protein [Bacilli bacterium]|nr:anaerobic ribonucleoside-triphosphate reductase activating protein [Bacilli bacterium]
MKIRLASSLQSDSIVDGEGIRTVVWTQGCPHHCPFCHNPSTHDFKGGFLVDIDEVKNEICNLKGQDGITLSGGDPMVQPLECLELAKTAHSLGMNVWCYTGYLFEDVIKNNNMKKLLEEVDVLVDGEFLIDQFSLDLYYKGSKNQRVIDVKKSLEEGKVVQIPKFMGTKMFSNMYKKEEGVFI